MGNFPNLKGSVYLPKFPFGPRWLDPYYTYSICAWTAAVPCLHPPFSADIVVILARLTKRKMRRLCMFLRCLGSAEYLLPGVIPARWCPYENDPGVQAGCDSFAAPHTHTISCLLMPHLSHRHSKVLSPARTGCAGSLCSNSGFSCFPLMPLIALSSPDG